MVAAISTLVCAVAGLARADTRTAPSTTMAMKRSITSKLRQEIKSVQASGDM